MSETETEKRVVRGFQWPTWYGGVMVSDRPPEVLAAAQKLRAKIGGLLARKQAGGAAFPVRSGKELMIKLRQALDELNYDAPVVAVEGGDVQTEKGTCAFVKSTVELRCPDGSFTRYVGIGHGADRDDKAGGKASTYAWKDALTKGLSIPDAEMQDTDDESGVSPRRGKKQDAQFNPETDGSPALKEFLAQLAKTDDVKGLIAEASAVLAGTERRVFADAVRARGAK